METNDKWFKMARAASERSALEYQAWFDASESMDEVKSQGTLDFFHRIWLPDCYEWIGNPHGQVALEIGSGGGRLLANAASIFDKAIGCDVVYGPGGTSSHTREYILNQGIRETKFDLIAPDVLSSIPDDSINFIYSFIAFQHMDNIDTIFNYLREIKRLSNPRNFTRIFCSGANIHGALTKSVEDNSAFDVTFMCDPRWFASNIKLLGGEVINIDLAPRKQLWNHQDRSGQFMISFRYVK